ncbi:hypothetical protein ETD85_23675 [Nonomuraea zeae]|uniref:Uncharacterized protein n=1 Tax=Nonomuraea zeae TaxID=1642303 RepID=A0A5S4GI37_9ACTN|nr:hypothetical protein ETD85_23675 [Nonomuraea zeae]
MLQGRRPVFAPRVRRDRPGRLEQPPGRPAARPSRSRTAARPRHRRRTPGAVLDRPLPKGAAPPAAG